MMKQFALAATLCASVAGFAQTPAATPTVPAAAAPAAATIPPPLVPILATYRFWPEQFVQWIGPELPYSMIELDVDQLQSKTIYDVVLTDRASQKRIHYSNMPLVVAAVKALDGEGYLANDIAFERPDAATTGATYTLKLTLHDGKPLEWRFIQGSDVMEQGGGLSAFPDSPMPVFAYREQAAVAGEGTAIQIGDAASSAEMWKEISRPPYFMAWHGAYSINATTLVLGGGDEKWTIASAPSSLSADATWRLTSSNGRTMNIQTAKLDGKHVTLSVEVAPGAGRRAIEADWDGTAWHYDQLKFIPHTGEKAALTLEFAPALSSDGRSTMEMTVGKKKIVSGVFSTDEAKQLTLSFKSPDWVKSKTVTASLTATGNDVELKSTSH